MTYDKSTMHVSTGASSSPPVRRNLSGVHPLTVWRAIRQALHFVLEVASEASRLRRTMHRQHLFIGE